MSRHMCFVLDLVNEAALIQEYCRMHEPGSVWPGVIDHIRAQGVESMEIWQQRRSPVHDHGGGRRLSAARRIHVARPRSDRWEAIHGDISARITGCCSRVKNGCLMRRIFVLADHNGPRSAMTTRIATRSIGSAELNVTELGFGAAPFGNLYDPSATEMP